MYKAKNNGLVINSRGEVIRFSFGSNIDAPKGSLDHCDDLEWIESVKEKPIIKETVEIKKKLPVKRKRIRKKS